MRLTIPIKYSPMYVFLRKLSPKPPTIEGYKGNFGIAEKTKRNTKRQMRVKIQNPQYSVSKCIDLKQTKYRIVMYLSFR